MTGARKHNSLEPAAGSPQTDSGSSGGPAFLVIGKLRRPHGLRGEILMEVITDFPERLQTGVTVHVGEGYRPMRIRTLRAHKQALLLAFDGITTPESAGEFRNQLVYVPTRDRPALPEGEYYHHQLLGLKVITDQGRELGFLHEILSTAANDVYIIRSQSGAEILLPAIESVILGVDLEREELLVHLLPGLLPD